MTDPLDDRLEEVLAILREASGLPLHRSGVDYCLSKYREPEHRHLDAAATVVAAWRSDHGAALMATGRRSGRPTAGRLMARALRAQRSPRA